MLSDPLLMPKILIIGVLAAFFIAVWLSVAYKKHKSPTLKYMAIFFWTKIIFLGLLIIATSQKLSLNTSVIIYNLSFIFINIGLYGGIVFFLSEIWFKPHKKTIRTVSLILLVLASLLSIVLIPKPHQQNPYNMSPEIIDWYQFFSHILIMTSTGLVFIYKGLRETDSKLIQKSLFLGVGMTVASLSGIILFLFTNIVVLNSLLILNAFGHVFMGIGALIRPKSVPAKEEMPAIKA